MQKKNGNLSYTLDIVKNYCIQSNACHNALFAVPCQPSPCINGGNCSVVNPNNAMAYFCACNERFFGEFCETAQKVQFCLLVFYLVCMYNSG